MFFYGKNPVFPSILCHLYQIPTLALLQSSWSLQQLYPIPFSPLQDISTFMRIYANKCAFTPFFQFAVFDLINPNKGNDIIKAPQINSNIKCSRFSNTRGVFVAMEFDRKFRRRQAFRICIDQHYT